MDRRKTREAEDGLTARELEVLRLLPNHTVKETAQQLQISEHTVKDHRLNLYQKLDTYANRTAAVMKGIRLGLIDLDSIVFPWESSDEN